MQIDDNIRKTWMNHGLVHLPGFVDSRGIERLQAWIKELADWPEAPGKWMKYFELGPEDERMLCRIENFTAFHSELRTFVYGELLALATELMEEPAVLFKEKINFKLPGGGGFAPHQDAPAFAAFGQRPHVSVMVSVDAAGPENGGMDFSERPAAQRVLPQRDDGTLTQEVVEGLGWRSQPTEPGDVVVFDSYVPHRSAPNDSRRPRRALYLTYNRARDGDRHADYIADKRRHFPPECEREPGTVYAAGRYNLGNPIAE